MNSTEQEPTSIPQLVQKLCKSLSIKNEAITTDLLDTAMRYLNTVPHGLVREEPFVLHQIREKMKSKSTEDVEKFDLLYSNLCKSTVIHNRTALLNFLYYLTDASETTISLLSGHQELNVKKWKPKSDYNIILQNGSLSNSHSMRTICGRRFTDTQSTPATTISSAWTIPEMPSSSRATISVSMIISEQELMQDVIYSLHGIQGKYLRREPAGLGYTIDAKTSRMISPTQKSLIERIIGMSYLHKQLKQYCDSNEKQSGAICQAFIATLNDELSDYYKTIALLQANLHQQTITQTDMTLRRILFMLQDHRVRFEWLAYIAEECGDKKGGALITAVHGFLQHGTKAAQEVSEKVLTAVCKPLYIMLSRWLLDGEINDPCNEFFIEGKSVKAAERLWHDKYVVRKSMIPSFINLEQAHRILATGKSINFLRHICRDDGQLPGHEALHKLFGNLTSDALFTPEQSIDFHAKLECIYKETSLRVLDLLKNNFHLNEHLQALRSYLLLGQGDFIRHLLELLAPELNKPATEIFGHTLSAILESAIRVTNAQYEDEDTLKRLNISFMSHSIGDIGWDVFSLMYIVDGPIGTIFQPSMPTYQSLFGALWKAKRTEFVLANMRRQQLSMAKLFRKIKELRPPMHIVHILTSKMIHFIHQTQYYFLFEVLECSWAELQNQVNKAGCLDDILKAHNFFLTSVQKGVLLDEGSRQLFSHLISIYNFVVKIESHQEAIYEAAAKENEAYLKYRAKAAATTGFGITSDCEAAATMRVAEFRQFLNTTKMKINATVETYDIIVTKFLELLASSSNLKLQLLSVRLSFNDFYKFA